MIDINRIKQTILNLNSGDFQVFCEQYLSLNGYKFISSKGGIPGTNITKQGTPDHICITDTDHYILIEDTTQKGKGLKQKIIADVKKCVINPKHMLPLDRIEKVVYCYNQELNDESIIEKCREICNSKTIEFEFLSLETFANDLFNNPIKYSRLAESCLGIALFWFGIESLDNFIENNEKIKLAPSFKTSFCGRKFEMDETISAIEKGENILLYGNPGVGKTRFAIEVCKSMENYGYATICIKGYAQISIHNLLEAIECIQEKRVIVFIDDVNEFSQLESIKDVFTQTSRELILISTVRNYAKSDIENRINNFTICKSVNIKAFSREESKEFLSNCFKINSSKFNEAIYRLSKGNPRLIVLAAKVTIKNQNLYSIADASALYDAYYGSIMNKLSCNNEQMMTLGLVAYENRIYLKNIDHLKSIFSVIGLSSEAFISECRFLSSLELFEINKDVVYYTDQSFKCFILKKVFIDKKVLSLGLMVKKLFFTHYETTKNTIRSILSIFGAQETREFIKSEVGPLVDDSEMLENKGFLSFLSFFCCFFPMQAIGHILNMMNSILSWTQEECTMVLEVLESFADSNFIDDAVEIMFQILDQRVDCTDNIVRILKDSFSYKSYSRDFDYCTQKAVLKKIENTLPSATVEQLNVIKSVLPQYIMTHFRYTETGESWREIRICEYELKFDEKLAEIRLLAWKLLFSIQGFTSGIVETLSNYAQESHGCVFDTKIGDSDWTQIKEYVKCQFDIHKLEHCLIVAHLCKKIPSIANSDLLVPFLFSKCYLLYKSLKRLYGPKMICDYENYALPESFVRDISAYTLNDYLFLFDTICESKRINAIYHSGFLILSIFKYVEKKNEVDLLKLADYCINIGIIEESFVISNLLSFLARHYSDEALLKFISSIDELYRNNWMWSYYDSKTERQVDAEVLKRFYTFLGTPDQKHTTMGYRRITSLKQYYIFDSSFFFNCLSIIEKNYKKAPFLYSNYLEDFFSKEPSQIVEYFKEDFALMFNCYCILILDRNEFNDYDGQFLAYVSCLDIRFLEKYILFVSQNCFRNSYDRLQSLWNLSSYIEFVDHVYFFARKNLEYDKLYSLFYHFFGNFHIETNRKEEVYDRIKTWFFHIIDDNKDDKAAVCALAELIGFIPMIIKSDCIVYLISKCDDFTIFEQIELIPSFETWSGSRIPILSERVRYLENLFQRINSPKYLRHRKKINNHIERLKEEIKETEIRELLDEWN